MVLLTPDCMIGIRDPQGIRPLCLGEIDGTWILSSESCGIQTAGGRLVRDIAPGEMLVLTRSGMVSERYARTGTIRHCLFEQVYFARADSCIDGMDVHLARFRSGVLLAGQAPVHADLVAGVPDSGITAALGFARASGIPYAQAIIRNASAGRSLQADTPRQHGRSLAIKYAVLNSVVAGKNIVLADDALVHGATLRHLVCRLREAGALTVHLRLASPPVICPCPYGITMPEQHELIAASMDQAALTRWLQADSLACLGLQELQTACSGDAPDQFCSSCFRAAACDDLSLDLPGMTRGSTSSDAIVTGMAPRPDLAQAEAAQTDHSLEGRSHV